MKIFSKQALRFSRAIRPECKEEIAIAPGEIATVPEWIKEDALWGALSAGSTPTLVVLQEEGQDCSLDEQLASYPDIARFVEMHPAFTTEPRQAFLKALSNVQLKHA